MANYERAPVLLQVRFTVSVIVCIIVDPLYNLAVALPVAVALLLLADLFEICQANTLESASTLDDVQEEVEPL